MSKPSHNENDGRLRWDEPPRRTPSDFERIRRAMAQSDEQITRRATEDRDNPPLTDEQLGQMRAVSPRPFVAAQKVLDQLADADDATVLNVVAGAATMLARRQRRGTSPS